ncbi:MAG: phosphoribosylformylglycinamidine cyclo-ligase [Candidatus Porifericomitaceae bacterium WSBS_2022_MAG_OTU9]
MNDNKTLGYHDAGVDIEAGERLVNAIGKIAKNTNKAGVVGGIGGFGGIFDLKAAGHSDPLLVAATDGVGTKLQLAEKARTLDKVGIDLVAMCANDVLALGATPLFFLDYMACGKLEPKEAEQLIGGIAEGCRMADMALLGGESAEMPGLYPVGSYDLAGFCLGAVGRGEIIDGSTIKQGDSIIAIASSGVHSNGYSLVRKILLQQDIDQSTPSLWPEQINDLLTPTKIYVKSVLPLVQDKLVRGIAHITGGGLPGNIPRILPPQMAAVLDATSWRWPQPFPWLQQHGNVTTEEMLRTFNCGIGMAVVVANSNRNAVIDRLGAAGEHAWLLGTIESGEQQVRWE